MTSSDSLKTFHPSLHHPLHPLHPNFLLSLSIFVEQSRFKCLTFVESERNMAPAHSHRRKCRRMARDGSQEVSSLFSSNPVWSAFLSDPATNHASGSETLKCRDPIKGLYLDRSSDLIAEPRSGSFLRGLQDSSSLNTRHRTSARSWMWRFPLAG